MKSWKAQWIQDAISAEEPLDKRTRKSRSNDQRVGYSKLKLLKVISYQQSLGYVQEVSV